MSQPPFVPGDKVTINGYFHGGNAHLNDVVRTVIKVKPSRNTASGWIVDADGPGFRKKATEVSMDAGWFKKAPVKLDSIIDVDKEQVASTDPRLKIIRKISEGERQGKSNTQIDKDFQRHVTKADLIGCIRYLLDERFF